MAHKLETPGLPVVQKTGEWHGVVVTTKPKDGKGPDGWHRVAYHIARCGVKTEGPGVAWVAQVGWDHKAECGESRKSGCGKGGARWLGQQKPDVVKAEGPDVAWVAHSGYKPSGKGR